MILKRFILFALILICLDSFSQNAKFKYWTELCDCKGIFDSTKITREQLQNTFNYLWWAPIIESDATAWTLDKIKELSVSKLKNECEERIDKLKTLNSVDVEFWSQLKEERINYYESTCRLREITILAYSNPDILTSYELVDSVCIYYRNALIAGGQQLIDAWIRLNESQKSKNVNPEKVQQKFDEKFNSALRSEYARSEIMKFGWWNSANDLLPHVNTSYDFAGEFERLLFDINCECDEP
jgi:hypothetical protein